MKKKNPCRQLRESDIRKMKEEATKKATNIAYVIFLNVMRDYEGYGVKRLQRVYEKINYLSDSITKGYVSLYDLEKVLRDEAGIVMGVK